MAPGAVKGYSPQLMKVWKVYRFTTGMTTRTVSPFEANVFGSLFANIGGKLKHKVVDNFWDVAPGLLTGVGTVFFIKAQRKAYLHSHRA